LYGLQKTIFYGSILFQHKSDQKYYLDCFYAYYDSQTNMLKIGGEYDDYQDQAYFESIFPAEKSKDFLKYEYPIPLDTFLELAEKMKKFFDERVEWVILYEDEFGKVHLEKYYRQDAPQP